MGIRKIAAEAASAVSTVALKRVFRRPAGNFPGKMALYIDPHIIAEQVSKLFFGSICVVGTNGKTTVTNLLADCLEAAELSVVCNRTGANLDSGVATSLLHAKQADWGVFECDELWLAKILPHLQSRFVILTNLFYDQLDRVGEVGNLQQSIAQALRESPETTLIYNADDPHCEKIARMVDNPRIPFGVAEDLGVAHDLTAGALICQQCDSMLDYAYRSYSQLGKYSCPTCDFERPRLRFSARDCQVGEESLSFDVYAALGDDAVAGGKLVQITAPFSGAYMVYNLLAVYVAAHSAGLDDASIQRTMSAYDKHNGRLETMDIHGRRVLLNLAKNPTGFNQNINLIMRKSGPALVAFFVNDNEGDGRDVSWLWDVDFEALAQREDTQVCVGGMRGNELQVRLKYAGIPAVLVEGATEVLHRAAALDDAYQVCLVANYTSLPEVRAECVKVAQAKVAPVPMQQHVQQPKPLAQQGSEQAIQIDRPLRIVHLYPDLLNQGGDAGNVSVLEKRCAWRSIPVEVQRVVQGQEPDFAGADIVVLGDGFDREQRVACEQLMPRQQELADYLADGGVMLAVDGGLQILGQAWYIGDDEHAGLGVLDITNGRNDDDERIVGDVVVACDLVDEQVIGFENHAGVTQLGADVQPFGEVLVGIGNNAGDRTEGAIQDNLVGTYVHGPVLAKSPQLADCLIAKALARCGVDVQLAELDDEVERNASAFMRKRLGVS